jgi:hypothetical protein
MRCCSSQIPSRGRFVVALAVACGLAPAAARADAGRLLSDDTFDVEKGSGLVIDGGVVAGLPAALPSGLSTGFGAGITRACGCMFAYGARASWSTVEAANFVWDVTQWDLRLRATGSIRHAVGRGILELRLGVGPTIVHESRVQNSGVAAGLTGMDLGSSATRVLPAVDLEAVVSIKVAGAWILVVSGGPSVDYNSGLRGGWISQLGVAWER